MPKCTTEIDRYIKPVYIKRIVPSQVIFRYSVAIVLPIFRRCISDGNHFTVAVFHQPFAIIIHTHALQHKKLSDGTANPHTVGGYLYRFPGVSPVKEFGSDVELVIGQVDKLVFIGGER